MKRTCSRPGIFSLALTLTLAPALLVPRLAQAQAEAPIPVTVTIAANGNARGVTTGAATATLSPDFLGLSYESSALLPHDDKYYFDSDDVALVNTFQTLGIKSLRVGANAVDDPRVPVPGVRDIDALFDFARAAGVKVIYSFRLKKGDPATTARLANYIAAHDSDALDSFAIGNEPSFYLKTFPDFFAHWKPLYDTILTVVPDAMFDGPSVAGPSDYAVDFADALAGSGHLAMASDHYYFLGSGRAGEKDPAATRARFLQLNRLHDKYEKDYAKVGAVLAARGVPYRIDEMNSCYNGGARDSSDTYASTLWALDCTHWWAAHHILGMNYHTGETVGRDGGFGAANYAAFVHNPNGQGLTMRPIAYALLAFTQSAHGQSLNVNVNVNVNANADQNAQNFNFSAYAYRDTFDDSYYFTLINTSYGAAAKPAAVSIQFPPPAGPGSEEATRTGKTKWRCYRMDLVQQNQDIAAKTGVTLGGVPITPDGLWQGNWKKIKTLKIKHNRSANIIVPVAPASATILRFAPEN